VSFKAFKLLVPVAVLVLLVLSVFKTHRQTPAQSASRGDPTAKIDDDPSRFLIRPFYARGSQIALALDGGQVPVAGGQVPSVVIGKNVLRTVHLAWLHDWTNPECRTLFRNLQSLYASEEGASLPALRIYLNPIFSDAPGEALHRAMLQVFFRSETRDSYLALANEMSTGALAANAEAIRNRIEVIAPVLIDDWDTRLDWLENDIEKTFSIARVQRARNAAIVGQDNAARLTSMLATLPQLANEQEMIAFLQSANASQRAWLQTLPPPPPGSPPVY
jgi:hypothetical protein